MNLGPKNLHTENLHTENLHTENLHAENLRAEELDPGKRDADNVRGGVESSSPASRVFNESVFGLFVAELGSEEVMLEYLASFEALLETRIRRIDRALQGRDEEETRTALLSLQASAAMAGATDLEAMTRRALAHNPDRPIPRAPLVRQLDGRADAFRHALAEFRLQRRPPAA